MLPSQSGKAEDKKPQNALNNVDELQKFSLMQ